MTEYSFSLLWMPPQKQTNNSKNIDIYNFCRKWHLINGTNFVWKLLFDSERTMPLLPPCKNCIQLKLNRYSLAERVIKITKLFSVHWIRLRKTKILIGRIIANFSINQIVKKCSIRYYIFNFVLVFWNFSHPGLPYKSKVKIN